MSRNQFTEEFKNDALKLLESSKKGVSVIASDLGIKSEQLYRWKRESNQPGKKAFTGNGISRDEEMTRLRKENAELRMERDILKKAVTIFSKPGNRNTGS
jgi:transposase